jgi:hypothetical protein
MDKRLQVFTHLAFLGLCLVGMAVGIKALFWPPPPSVVVAGGAAGQPRPEPMPLYSVGEQVEVPGVAFGDREQTLLLVTQKGCRFCDQSMPFYKELGADQGVAARTRVVLLAPDPDEVTREELAKYGVRVDQVVRVPLGRLKVRGTPTAILVGRDGVVSGVWTGLLDEARQAEVRTALAGPAGN